MNNTRDNKPYDIELSSWESLVLAREQELASGQSLIHRPFYETRFKDHYADSILVGNTPSVLRKMGFDDRMVYDCEHFMEHMQPDYGTENGAQHGHDGTADELLRLPELLSHPVAVVSMDAVEGEMITNKSYRPVGILMAYDNNGTQEYKLAVVQPHELDTGTTRGFCEQLPARGAENAARIISYHDVPEKKFTRIMDDAVKNNNAGLIYFDPSEYGKIDFQIPENNHFGDIELNETRKVSDFARSRPDLEIRQANLKKYVSQCINNALMSHTQSNFMPHHYTRHSYVDELLDVLNNPEKHSFGDVTFAYLSCRDMAKKYTQEPASVERKLTENYLKIYAKMVQPQHFKEIMDPYFTEIETPISNFSENAENR